MPTLPRSYADCGDDDDGLRRQIQEAVTRYPLPAHWKAVATTGSEAYYWNRLTDETTWQHPLLAVAGDVLHAARDVIAAGAADPDHDTARQRRVAAWARRWQDGMVRELESWRCHQELAGSEPYYYRVTGPQDSGSAVTWEDPRTSLELKRRFQTETLASLFRLPAPDPNAPFVEAEPSQGAYPERGRSSGRGSRRGYDRGCMRRQLKRAEGGQCFEVQIMPSDNSCGFHGLGVSREAAAAALQRHRSDPEVQEFVAADLAAAVQSGDRSDLPPEIQHDTALWEALDAYYQAQHLVDGRAREVRELLSEEPVGGSAPPELRWRLEQAGHVGGQGSGDDVLKAVRQLFAELKRQASALPSGALKLQLMHRLGRCQVEAKSLEAALAGGTKTRDGLRRRCCARFEEYVNWVGTNSLFWLSFIRGVGGDRSGGLLDAIAKVAGLTVRVWSEKDDRRDDPELELVHKAPFGPREVDLWWRGVHFDRLVLSEGRASSSAY